MKALVAAVVAVDWAGCAAGWRQANQGTQPRRQQQRPQQQRQPERTPTPAWAVAVVARRCVMTSQQVVAVVAVMMTVVMPVKWASERWMRQVAEC